MRETRTVTIEGINRKIRVNELTVRELLEVLQAFDITTQSLGDLRVAVMTRFLPMVTDLKEEELLSLAPSRIAKLWDSIKEVNASFFDFADLVGLGDVVRAIRAQVLGIFSQLLANSSRQVTRESGTTDSAS